MDIRTPQPIFKNLSAQTSEQNLSRFVLSLDTNKSLGADAGSFSVTLVPSPDFTSIGASVDNFESVIYRSIRPMDVVLVGINNVIMFGFVDNVYKSKAKLGQSIQRAVIIRGRDATKLFIEDSIAPAPELAANPKLETILGKSATQFLGLLRGTTNNGKKNAFVNSTVPQAIFWILENIPSINISIDQFGGVVTNPANYFLHSIVGRAEDKIYNDPMSQYSGKVINYFSQTLDAAFYELWIDTLPKESQKNKTGEDRPVLFVRPKPFDREGDIDSEGRTVIFDGLTVDSIKLLDREQNDDVPTEETQITSWNNLTCPVYDTVHEIPEEEIVRKGLGVSDYDVMTMYKLEASKDPIAVSQIGMYGHYFPLLDSQLVKLFGLRQLTAVSGMLPPPIDAFLPPPGAITNEDLDTPNRFVGLFSNRPARELFADSFKSIRDYINSLNLRANANQVKFLVADKRDRIWRWNRYNHIYESGILSCKGRDIRVGSKVFLPDEETRGFVRNDKRDRQPFRGMQFYCTGVRQAYRFGDSWITNLSLVRGHNPEEIKLYDTARKFDEKKPESVFIGEFNLSA